MNQQNPVWPPALLRIVFVVYFAVTCLDVPKETYIIIKAVLQHADCLQSCCLEPTKAVRSGDSGNMCTKSTTGSTRSFCLHAVHLNRVSFSLQYSSCRVAFLPLSPPFFWITRKEKWEVELILKCIWVELIILRSTRWRCGRLRIRSVLKGMSGELFPVKAGFLLVSAGKLDYSRGTV